MLSEPMHVLSSREQAILDVFKEGARLGDASVHLTRSPTSDGVRIYLSIRFYTTSDIEGPVLEGARPEALMQLLVHEGKVARRALLQELKEFAERELAT